MQFDHTQFTLGFRQALDHGIDYRDFDKVDRLPKSVPLMAIAGVWGDYNDIRCLFIDQIGKTYRRHITGRADQYIVRELDLNAKEMEVGQVVVVEND
ncbi:hypothetical protein [Sulfitobacter aestuariivivens]|uniref:Uncharacterized protein n=1 Tax=Sulfitobacter aestuariivivens TaxID=2766981 RepID=A0A927HFX9_9RHOB|nr:hypothetical protein [Sulfitobacter aestuariivivens]MBD3664913.1 hypothetical protein [Sulfitobacter aestuariivivens]